MFFTDFKDSQLGVTFSLESSLETRNVLQNFFFLFLQGDCILLPFSTEFLLVTLASASTFSWYSFSESTTKPKLPKSTGPTIKNFLLQLYYRVIIISYCYLTCFFHAYDACYCRLHVYVVIRFDPYFHSNFIFLNAFRLANIKITI